MPLRIKEQLKTEMAIIRMFFPKKTDFNSVTIAEVKRVENEINNRPRKKI